MQLHRRALVGRFGPFWGLCRVRVGESSLILGVLGMFVSPKAKSVSFLVYSVLGKSVRNSFRFGCRHQRALREVPCDPALMLCVCPLVCVCVCVSVCVRVRVYACVCVRMLAQTILLVQRLN